MSLKLYRINTMINHPDNMAGFYKEDKEILIGLVEYLKSRKK